MTVASFWAGASQEVAVTTGLRGSTWTGRGGRSIGRISGEWWELNHKTLSGKFPVLSMEYDEDRYVVDTGSGLVETTFPPLHTYTGASLATQTDDAGLMKFKPHNLQINSSDFDNASWSNERLTISTNFAIAPDGTQTADKLTNDAGTNAPYRLFDQQNGGENNLHIFSVYVKNNAGTRGFYMRMNRANGNQSFVHMNPITGALGTVTAGITGAVTDIGDGWFLVTMNVNTRANNDNFLMGFSEGAGEALSYTSDAGDSMFLWEAQNNRAPMADAKDTYAPNSVPTTAAAVFQHRLDHDGGGNSVGLLKEEARTNIALRSNNLLTLWTKVNILTPTAATTGPDGVANSGWLLQDDDGGGDASARVAQIVVVELNTTYVLSAFFKADQLSKANVRITGFTTPGTSNSYFDLTNGGSALTKEAGFIDSGTIEFANGWVRCWASFLTGGVDTGGNIHMQMCETDNDTTVHIDGSSSIFFFGAVLEPGSFPGTYIPTTSVSVTRLIDDAPVATSDWDFSATAGSIYGVVTPNHLPSSELILFSLNDGTADEVIEVYIDSSANVRFRVTDGGVDQCDIDSLVNAVAGTELKIAVSWAANDFAISVNSNTIAVNTSGTLPTVTTLDQCENGHTVSLTPYKTALSDAELVARTV